MGSGDAWKEAPNRNSNIPYNQILEAHCTSGLTLLLAVVVVVEVLVVVVVVVVVLEFVVVVVVVVW